MKILKSKVFWLAVFVCMGLGALAFGDGNPTPTCNPFDPHCGTVQAK